MHEAAYRRRVLTALLLTQMLVGLAQGVSYTMGALLSASMAGPAWGGAAATVTTVGAGVWAVPLARIVEKRGRRASLSAGLALGSVGGTCALAGAQTGLFPVVVLGFFFLGAAVAVNLQSRFAAAEVASARTSGRDISLVVWATTVGAVVGPTLFGPTERLGTALGLESFSGAYLVSVSVQVIALVFVQAMLKPVAPRVSSAASGPKPALSEHPLVASAVTWNAVSHFAMTGIMSMTAVHLHSLGASLGLIGLTMSCHVAGMYALAPVWGALADRLSARVVMGLGTAMTVTTTVILMWAPGKEEAVVAALVLLGLGWSSTFVGSSVVIATGSPPEHRASLQGRSDSAMNFTGAAGGLISGPLVANAGIPAMAALVLVLIAVQQLVSFRLRHQTDAADDPRAESS